MPARIAEWARAIRRELRLVYLAGRDPRTPSCVRILALADAVYALCPIDLVPDFVPMLGHLDDLILVPLGIMLVPWLMPDELRQELRRTAAGPRQPTAHWVGAVVGGTWLTAAAALGAWVYRRVA